MWTQLLETFPCVRVGRKSNYSQSVGFRYSHKILIWGLSIENMTPTGLVACSIHFSFCWQLGNLVFGGSTNLCLSERPPEIKLNHCSNRQCKHSLVNSMAAAVYIERNQLCALHVTNSLQMLTWNGPKFQDHSSVCRYWRQTLSQMFQTILLVAWALVTCTE